LPKIIQDFTPELLVSMVLRAPQYLQQRGNSRRAGAFIPPDAPLATVTERPRMQTIHQQRFVSLTSATSSLSALKI
jgi:hypothetical protein